MPGWLDAIFGKNISRRLERSKPSAARSLRWTTIGYRPSPPISNPGKARKISGLKNIPFSLSTPTPKPGLIARRYVSAGESRR